MTVRQNLQRHIVIVGLFIILVGLFSASDALHDRIEDLIVWTESVISQAPVLGMVLFVLLAMVSAMVAFFSSAVFTPIAIYAWGKAGTLILLWLGWLLGGILSFIIGRYLGRSVAGMIIEEEKISGWEQELGERAKFVHVLLFQAAVPSEIPGYVLGILHYRFLWYLAALAITELPYAVGAVYLGESFLQGETTVFVFAGIAIIVSGLLLVRLIRRLRSRSESIP